MDEYYKNVDISIRTLLEHLDTERNKLWDLIDEYEEKEQEFLKNHDHGSAAEYRKLSYECSRKLRKVNNAINSICCTIDEIERKSRKKEES